MEIALEVKDVFFRLDSRVIFQDLNLHLPKGETLFVLGDSGSGKSLLLRICTGLILPEQGRVVLGGINLKTAPKEMIQELRAKVGFVFQDSALISNMAIYDNIALPIRYHKKWTEARVRARVEEQMERFGVDRAFDRSLPALLSLEMRKRAALARAFILDPEFLFLDQPVSGLEAETAHSLGQIIRDCQQKSGASLLEVGSEHLLSGGPAARVGLLEGGRITAEGTMEEMEAYLEEVRKGENSKPRSPKYKG